MFQLVIQKVHVDCIQNFVGKEKVKAFFLLPWLCFIRVLAEKGAKYKD